MKEAIIGGRKIGHAHPVYVIAEMSANHNMDIARAKDIIQAAKESGADAVKLQTYTPDTITIDCDRPEFRTQGIWEGQTLYELYKKAYTPWEWHEELQEHAQKMGITLFSSPFDLTAVDFLEKLDMPAYKVASFEITDIPLLRRISRTGRPTIISTGIATLSDVDLAVRTCREEGNSELILLKCVSEYPAPYERMNLRTITNLREMFGCIIGISDHSMGDEVAVASVALGAKVIEKHFTLRRSDGGEDSAFSMEPEEFATMVQKVRNIEQAMGDGSYQFDEKQRKEREGARSLYVVQDIQKGEVFTPENMRSIRPGLGLHTVYWEDILGRKAACDLRAGTPMKWDFVGKYGGEEKQDEESLDNEYHI